MATQRFEPFGFADTTAEAQRVMIVGSTGTPSGGLTPVDLGVDTARYATADTFAIDPAMYVQIVVVNAAGASFPTVDGTPVPEGTYTYKAPAGSVLPEIELVTDTGDDVVVVRVFEEA